MSPTATVRHTQHSLSSKGSKAAAVLCCLNFYLSELTYRGVGGGDLSYAVLRIFSLGLLLLLFFPIEFCMYVPSRERLLCLYFKCIMSRYYTWRKYTCKGGGGREEKKKKKKELLLGAKQSLRSISSRQGRYRRAPRFSSSFPSSNMLLIAVRPPPTPNWLSLSLLHAPPQLLFMYVYIPHPCPGSSSLSLSSSFGLFFLFFSSFFLLLGGFAVFLFAGDD